ncbi:MAG: ChaN family lipoprotein [Pseudomonadota bacterium]
MRFQILYNHFKQIRSRWFVIPVLLLTILFVGCAHLSGVSHKKAPPSFVIVEGNPRPFVKGEIVRMSTGHAVSFEEMMEDLRQARIVYVGETHVNRAHHDIQLMVLQGIFEKNQSVRVGMEMFERSYQPLLDRWSTGGFTEETFLKKVNWKENWSYDFSLYRKILHFIRENRIGFTALNVPSKIVKKVATQGLASLTEEERNQIAKDIDLSDPEHRAFVKERFAAHDTDDLHGFDNFYEAQCVWDGSMAGSVEQVIQSVTEEVPVVVFAGNGHIEKFGIPKRVQRRVNVPYMTVMPVSVGETVKEAAADYIWVTKEVKMPKHPLIGIRIKPVTEGDGLLIEGVMPGSPGEAAGIQENDILISIDGRPVSSVSDIHDVVLYSEAPPTHLFKIKRGEETLELPVTPRRERDRE